MEINTAYSTSNLQLSFLVLWVNKRERTQNIIKGITTSVPKRGSSNGWAIYSLQNKL